MSEVNLSAMADLVSLCKRRGFIFQSSEIYGGLGSCWDYGPLGVEMKNTLKQAWWKTMTMREDIEGVDASILMHPLVWKASGHVDGFTDPLVDCKACKARFREDKIDVSAACPNCGVKGQFTEARAFNLMFKTQMGPLEDSSALVYLRPETAQGIFTNFLNIQNTMRKRIPFGIAQIGKAFRNEITPGNFIFRTREFEQMEMQYFVEPGSQKKFMEEWKETRYNWHKEMGLRESKLRFHPHGAGELAHYADAALDIQYEFPIGWDEIEGIHSRTDFDLKNHQEYSKKNLQYVDQLNNNQKYIPYVVETSAGCDRTLLAILCDAYRVEFPGDQEKERTVFRFDHKMAPVKVAILPLMKKDGLEEKARLIFNDLKKQFKVDFDVSSSIGKRYRRQDEIGTPFCLTVDYETFDDHAVTVRERDSMKQERVALDQINKYFSDNLKI